MDKKDKCIVHHFHDEEEDLPCGETRTIYHRCCVCQHKEIKTDYSQFINNLNKGLGEYQNPLKNTGYYRARY